MSALNDARAAAIQAAVDILQAGPDTEDRRKDARRIIDTVLNNTELEKYRISGLIIPFPAPASNNTNANATSGDGGVGGIGGLIASATLPPINTEMLNYLKDFLDTSTDIDLADAKQQWDLMYN